MISIRTDIQSLNANYFATRNQTAVSKTLQKLATGFKINSASDDAAGLALSEYMRANIKGLTAASENAQDGINFAATAEGAIAETQSMLNRVNYLTLRAANGIYTDDQRKLYAKEVNLLFDEMDRVYASTKFNNKLIFDGSLARIKPLESKGDGNFQSGEEVKGYLSSISFDTIPKEDLDITIADLKAKYGDATVDAGFVMKLGVLGNMTIPLSQIGFPSPEVFGGMYYEQYKDHTVREFFQVTLAGDPINGIEAMASRFVFPIYGENNEVIAYSLQFDSDGNITFYHNPFSDEDEDGEIYDLPTYTNDKGEVISFDGDSELDNNLVNLVDSQFYVQIGPHVYTPKDAYFDGAMDASSEPRGAIARYQLKYDAINGSTVEIGNLKFENIHSGIDLFNEVVKLDNKVITVDGIDYELIVDTGGRITLQSLKKESYNWSEHEDHVKKLDSIIKLNGKEATATTNIRVNRKINGQAGATKSFAAIDFAGMTTDRVHNSFIEISVPSYIENKDGTFVKTFSEPQRFVIEVEGMGKADEFYVEGTERIRYNGTISIKAGSNDVQIAAKVIGDVASYFGDYTGYVDGTIAYFEEIDPFNRKGPYEKGDIPAPKLSIKNIQNGLRLQVGDTNNDYDVIRIYVEKTNTKVLGLDRVKDALSGNLINKDLTEYGGLTQYYTTQEAAALSTKYVKDAIDILSSMRAEIGAYQNRLRHTVNYLDVAVENLTDADSRIRDTNMAKTMGEYIKQQALLQTNSMIQAHAFNSAQGVLKIIS